MENIKAKKKFGQNFLKDETIIQKIIQAIPKDSIAKDIVVEIGPGLGDLTSWLLKSGFNVLSYEIDQQLVPKLQNKFQKQLEDGKFRLINKDANKAWQEQGSLRECKYMLVANLPYYVATKMILNALQDSFCVGIVAMVQKEVALKFSASGGESEFGSLGVLANLSGECDLLFDVGSQCFEPAPMVISSVIYISKDRVLFGENGIFTDFREYEKFQVFLKTCFVAPRKILFKNLVSKFNKELLNSIFAKLGLRENIRPHELNVALYLEIYNLIKVKNEREQRRKGSN